MQTPQPPSWTACVLFPAMIMAGFFANIGVAQVVSPTMYEGGSGIPNHLLYEFRSESGDIVAKGQFVDLQGATLTIRHSDRTFGAVKLSEICRADNDWVKRQVALQKKQAIRADDAKLIVNSINKTQPRSIIKGCSKLRPLGRAASGVEKNIQGLIAVRDVRAKRACLTVYPRICALEVESLQYLRQLINQNKHDAYDVVSERPKQFLVAVASMDYVGLPYLQHVANRCTLKTDVDWQRSLAQPIELTFAEGKKSALRKAAIEAIGEIESEAAASALVDLAATVAMPINGKRDDKMIAALITSLGKIGVNNSEVMSVLRRHQVDFPKETAKSLERIEGK